MRQHPLLQWICALPACTLFAAVACDESHASTASSATPQAAPSASAPVAKPKLACPLEMSRLGNYCIDKWEAHTVTVANPSVRRSPYEPLRDGERVAARSAAGVVPQGYISREEARAACVNSGKRLCSAKEWYRACAGNEGRHYPYGATQQSGICNTQKPHVLTQVFGRKVFLTKDSHYNNPKVNQEPGFLALTGANPKCVTPEGVFDMVGNLHEWVADDVSAALPKTIPLEYGEHWLGPKGSGIFMGGYYSSKNEHGRGCAYTTATHAPDYHDYSTGFRCCRDAD
ncbi:MAG: SUMF1/EgtB/PvdO family nonheme iron enzyme [Polyangiaceae bacterium]